MNTNIRGINGGEKQEAFAKVVEKEQPHVVCMNETKLQYDLYFNNHWSYQTLYARKGGCWTAARYADNVRLSLVKALGTYLCWTRLNTGTESVQILNCYLEGGDMAYAKQIALRVCEIVQDILRQDENAAIVVCGDFNNHLDLVSNALHSMNFVSAIAPDVATQKFGNHLD
jgi:exonuclease III